MQSVNLRPLAPMRAERYCLTAAPSKRRGTDGFTDGSLRLTAGSSAACNNYPSNDTRLRLDQGRRDNHLRGVPRVVGSSGQQIVLLDIPSQFRDEDEERVERLGVLKGGVYTYDLLADRPIPATAVYGETQHVFKHCAAG